MDTIRQAVILLSPLSSGYRILFEKEVAGLKLFLRLLLTLQNSGIDEFFIFSSHLTEEERIKIDARLKSDFRFTGKLFWIDRKRFFQNEDTASLKPLENSRGFLLMEGNRVTTPGLIQEFIKRAWRVDTGVKSQIAQLTLEDPEKIFIFPPHSTDRLVQFLKNESIDEAIVPIEIEMEGEPFLMQTIEGAPDARQADCELIRKQKFHYSRIADKWFNAYFSLPVSSALVKTALTPNQISLSGLFIGLSAGWFFSWGNYLGGLFGAILLAGTAIWDCCDGTVARLKFLESAFGKTLSRHCRNIIKVFIVIGMVAGMAKSHGTVQAFVPFSLLLIGATAIFAHIMFAEGGKGLFLKSTWIYKVIQVLARKNFIYILLIFAVFGHVDLFLWVTGVGCILAAVALFIEKMRLTPKARQPNKPQSVNPSTPPQ
jgi:phosphatidylglycerophosphate synthase